jgi:hypothetical protein
MERKFNLAEAAKYIAGDSAPIPARRMRELAKLITHVRVSRREWLFLQSDLDDFLVRASTRCPDRIWSEAEMTSEGSAYRSHLEPDPDTPGCFR